MPKEHFAVRFVRKAYEEQLRLRKERSQALDQLILEDPHVALRQMLLDRGVPQHVLDRMKVG